MRMGLLSLLLLCGAAGAQTPLGSAFSYQGTLRQSGAPASGNFDFEVCLYGLLSGGAALGCAPFDDVLVTDGVFTVTPDFGFNAFNGDQRFVELRVRPGASSGSYTTLSPRQPLLAVPYALNASNGGGGGTTSTVTLSEGVVAGANGLAVGPDGIASLLVVRNTPRQLVLLRCTDRACRARTSLDIKPAGQACGTPSIRQKTLT